MSSNKISIFESLRQSIIKKYIFSHLFLFQNFSIYYKQTKRKKKTIFF